MWSSTPRLFFHITALSALIASCATPCKDLSTQICNCEPTELEQRACTQRVENEEANRSVSDAEMQTCADILAAGECTCEALANGDLGACGLAIAD